LVSDIKNGVNSLKTKAVAVEICTFATAFYSTSILKFMI